jgi:DNA-binding response OmpR family regulator
VRHPASLVGERAVDIDDAVTVLLIEDDEAAAEMYRLRLAADGYTVLIASDGEQGLRRAVEDRPDLIYLDVRLPKMDGFEVLERLRANVATASIPVVIVTNYGEPELQQRGLSLGALEFLVKADTTPARLSQTFERLSETESVRS